MSARSTVTPRSCPESLVWELSTACAEREGGTEIISFFLSFSLQRHACFPLSSLQSIPGGSSFTVFLCVSFIPHQQAPFLFLLTVLQLLVSVVSSALQHKTKTNSHISHLQRSDFSPSPMLKNIVGPVATPLKDQTSSIRWRL